MCDGIQETLSFRIPVDYRTRDSKIQGKVGLRYVHRTGVNIENPCD